MVTAIRLYKIVLGLYSCVSLYLPGEARQGQADLQGLGRTRSEPVSLLKQHKVVLLCLQSKAGA